MTPLPTNDTNTSLSSLPTNDTNASSSSPPNDTNASSPSSPPSPPPNSNALLSLPLNSNALKKEKKKQPKNKAARLEMEYIEYEDSGKYYLSYFANYFYFYIKFYFIDFKNS